MTTEKQRADLREPKLPDPIRELCQEVGRQVSNYVDEALEQEDNETLNDPNVVERRVDFIAYLINVWDLRDRYR
jgi:hypothetical protein